MGTQVSLLQCIRSWVAQAELHPDSLRLAVMVEGLDGAWAAPSRQGMARCFTQDTALRATRRHAFLQSVVGLPLLASPCPAPSQRLPPFLSCHSVFSLNSPRLAAHTENPRFLLAFCLLALPQPLCGSPADALRAQSSQNSRQALLMTAVNDRTGGQTRAVASGAHRLCGMRPIGSRKV